MSDLDLEIKISELNNLYYEYKNKLNDIKDKIKITQNKIYENCEKKNNGHKWIMEKETCMYGETFYYCMYCNLEK